MVSIYDVKPKFQALLRPITRTLARLGVTANHVTLSAVALSVGVGAAVYVWGNSSAWPLYLLPIFLFVRMALNAIDGMLAREHDMATPLGAILNELGDVLSDTAMFLPLAVLDQVSAPWIIAVVVLSVISEMAGVVAIQIGASRRYDGPMGKSDRAFVMGAVALALALGYGREQWITIALMAITALLVVTILNRCRHALREAAQLNATDPEAAARG